MQVSCQAVGTIEEEEKAGSVYVKSDPSCPLHRDVNMSLMTPQVTILSYH